MLNQKIENGTATYDSAAEFSKVLGDLASKSIRDNIGEDIAEDELEKLAQECLAPVYRQCQDTMLGASKSIQKLYNDQAGINLNPVEVKRDENRISNLVDRFKEAESYNDVAFLTGANTARSITRGAVTDSVRENAKFQDKVGIDVLISRSDGSGCCDWCSSVCGTFKSFDALPDGFWGIHRGCSCVIDYRVGKTKSRLSYMTDAKGNVRKNTEENEYGYQYGEKAINVDLKEIKSEEYRNKFNSITDNDKVNESIYNNAVKLLEDNTGTFHEDLCIIDLIDGDLLAKETSSKSNSGVIYSDEFNEKIQKCKDENKKYIGMHNHPQGTPPSGNDFRKAYENGYQFGVVPAHNGLLYVFETPKKPLSKQLADQITENVVQLSNSGFDVDRACKEVYDYYDLKYTIVRGGTLW